MEKVSIVVPVYNTSLEQFRMCVESIRKQTYTNYEVILVDDGSGNGVENLCDEYVQRDRRFHVLHQPNCGLSGARNRGTDLADGKWLIYLDPDDWWEPDTLELLCEKMERDMLDVLFFSYFDCYENKSQVERRCWKKPGQEYTFLTDKQKRNLQMGMLDESVAELPGCFGSACMQMVRLETVRKAGLRFKENLRKTEDLPYELELLENPVKAAVLDRSFYHYRHHGKSVCNFYNPKITEILGEVNHELLGFVRNRDEAYKSALRYYMMKNYISILRLNYFHSLNQVSWRERKKTWKDFLKPSRDWSFLQEEKTKNIFKKRKAYGILFFVTFRLKSFELLRLSYNRLRDRL